MLTVVYADCAELLKERHRLLLLLAGQLVEVGSGEREEVEGGRGGRRKQGPWGRDRYPAIIRNT